MIPKFLLATDRGRRPIPHFGKRPMTDLLKRESTALPAQQALAFAPIHKRHFGTAIGVVVGLSIFALTVLHVMVAPEEDYPLSLLSEYFFGYRVSYSGAFIGAAWGFLLGWIAGWFVALCRNFLLTAMVFWVRAKANLQTSSDFLDHL